MATREEIIGVIHLLKRLPNSPITGNSPEAVKQSLEDVATLFSAVLEDLPADMVKAATVQYCSEGNPFFPMPGVLRDKAMELQMLALGIPTPAEAWAMVLQARQYVQARYCEDGARLRSRAAGGDITGTSYWNAVIDFDNHVENCGDCESGGFKEIYGHTAVEETVKMLGGREVILTDNPTADRARFIEAYREVVSRERMKMAMTPKVAAYVETVKPIALQAGTQIKQLVKGMTK